MKVKLRSKKSLNKRFKVLAAGQLKHGHAYHSHLAASKSPKRKRHLRKNALLNNSDRKRLKKMLIN